MAEGRYAALREELRSEPRRWLVTGAAGFIGSALVEELLGLGQEVVGLDSFLTGHEQNLDDVRSLVGSAAASFRFIEGDIVDAKTCGEAVEGADYVLHQAALGSVPRSIENPQATHRANVDGFLNILLAARDAGVSRFVFASSSSVYGDHPALPKVEDQIGRPLSPYAVTKRIDELYAGVVSDSYQLETVGLRYFNVFGRRQDPEGPYSAVIPRWLDRLLSGERCQIFGDGSNSRDFCYVDNAVQANLLAAVYGAPAGATSAIYNVGCNGNTTLRDLFWIIRDRLAESRPEIAAAEPDYGPARPGDVAHSQASIDKISAELGYVPSHDVSAGLTETVRWYLRARA